MRTLIHVFMQFAEYRWKESDQSDAIIRSTADKSAKMSSSIIQLWHEACRPFADLEQRSWPILETWKHKFQS